MTQARLIDIWIFIHYHFSNYHQRDFQFLSCFCQNQKFQPHFCSRKTLTHGVEASRELLTLAPVAPEDSLCGLVN